MKITDVVVGIDIGGTNSAFGLVDKSGNCLFMDSVPTQSEKPAKLLVQKIYQIVARWVDDAPEKLSIKGIGVGAPNGNYYSGCIEDPPNLNWESVNLVELFQTYTQVPVFVTNDANAAALGELEFGAARGMTNFIEITLGTGLGSGLVVNGELVYGNDGHAGELGHVIVAPDGRPCGCGRNGCLETYASATGICTTVNELLSENSTESILKNVSAQKLSAKMISDAAEDGDRLALEAFQITGDILGRAMANAVAYLSPQAIIFFGGLAQAGALLFEPMQKSFDAALLHIYRDKVSLIHSGLKDGAAAIVGAGALVWHELSNHQ